MQRTYLATLGLGALLAAGSTLVLTPIALVPAARAAALFESRPVEVSRFAILAKPVARSDWSLMVLEQLRPAPACWQQRSDGLIDAALTRFDYSGICSRYIDSNGYSLRVGEVDLSSRYRLQLRQMGQELQLLGSSPDSRQDLLLGRGSVLRRDRDGFAAIALEPGWHLRRRVYGGQTLNHIYFASDANLAQLTRGDAAPPRTLLTRSDSPESDPGSASGAGRSQSRGGYGSGPIALRVIPFRE
ncbi:DUF3747 domain-containing protein [Cyanobium sp. Morenito 9A2]|uniref:DUF3747 domain-containing protein n=1 Tax=Cyanobium sp. Morenito 9A2 TaxID=2823718 RepID=UPI0020CEB2FE|nr:DUF3747 domain-containing protein [Cyanobium sp. Morenito 9A2]MCP9850021.1 DUF3747 domain-containing protein [Cyanobium sp. Morenito 9A2]